MRINPTFCTRTTVGAIGPGRPNTACLGAVFLAATLELAAVGEGTVRGRITCPSLSDCGGAVVYVEKIPGRRFAPGPRATMDQVRLAFVPHVLHVVTGTTVAFPNSDDVRHNVFSASKAKRFNLGTYPKGVTRHVVFDTPGLVELLCNVHAEMSAYIIVADTPYAEPVQADGSYVLMNVPAGTLTVTAWHEKLREQRQVVTVRELETVTLNFDLR